MSPDDPRHGTYAGDYAHKRSGIPICDPCRLARNEYALGRYKDKVLGRRRTYPRLGVQRRIEALQSMGWSLDYIAARLDTSVGKIRHSAFSATYVTARRRQQVVALYDELSMTLPTDSRVNRRRGIARRKGYAPPLAWDNIDDPDERPDHGGREPRHESEIDDVAIERRLQGDKTVRLNHKERVEARSRWLERDLGSLAEFERRTGINTNRDKRAA